MSENSTKQELLFQVNIFEEDTVLSDHRGDCPRHFAVDQAQLMNFFRTEVTFRPEPGLLWKKTNGITETYLFRFPKQPRKIFVMEKKKLKPYKIHFPSLLLQVRVGQGQITDVNGWCHAGSLRDDTVLYEIPLPNFSGADLCLGSVDCTVERNVREAVEQVVFDTPFNHHNNLVGKDGIPFQKFHKLYQGKFPFHKLNRLCRARQIL